MSDTRIAKQNQLGEADVDAAVAGAKLLVAARATAEAASCAAESLAYVVGELIGAEPVNSTGDGPTKPPFQGSLHAVKEELDSIDLFVARIRDDTNRLRHT